jgi:hypothetical protein
VEAPTVDIISSSLNGLSLSVFSGSGLPELDIFAVRDGAILANRGVRRASESVEEGFASGRYHRRDL